MKALNKRQKPFPETDGPCGPRQEVARRTDTVSHARRDSHRQPSDPLSLSHPPLFEFWGVPADPATKRIVEALPPATEFIERLELYKSAIPANESAQRSEIERLIESSGNSERWFYYLDNYDPAVADFMHEKIDRLIGEIR
jgi:hypothetical protein